MATRVPGHGPFDAVATQAGRQSMKKAVLEQDVLATDTTNTLRLRNQLREAILSGRIAPGSRLRTAAVSEMFDTSRTPAREALLMLAREGLLDIIPRRGAVVRSFDIADVMELYEVRALLEPLAAKRAASRIETQTVDRLQE